MRPTPREMIDGIRRVLREEIEPALEDEHARARLREVRAALAAIDWDDAGFALAARNAALAGALHAVATWRAGDPERQAAFPPFEHRETSGSTFADQQRTARDLGAAAAALAPAFAAWIRDRPRDSEAIALRETVLTATLVGTNSL